MAYLTTAKTFFEKQLPGLLARRELDALTGLVEFDVDGPQGGSWLVDFSARKSRPATGEKARPAAVVAAQERDFMALLEGRMSPEDGVLTRRLRLTGEAVMLSTLMKTLAGISREAR